MRLEFGKRHEREPKVEKAVPVVCSALTESMGVSQLFSLSEADKTQFTRQLAFPVVELILDPYLDRHQNIEDQLLEKRLKPDMRHKLGRKYPIKIFQSTGFTPDEKKHQRVLNDLMESSFQQVLDALSQETQRRSVTGSPKRENLVKTFRLSLVKRLIDRRVAAEPIHSVSDFPFPQVHLTDEMRNHLRELHSSTRR